MEGIFRCELKLVKNWYTTLYNEVYSRGSGGKEGQGLSSIEPNEYHTEWDGFK